MFERPTFQPRSFALLRNSAIFLALFTGSTPVIAKVKVVTSVPELAYAANEIGGDLVEAESLLSGAENPHMVSVVPKFTRMVGVAQVVCLVGLDLEASYLTPLLERSGNKQVQLGGKGYCDVSHQVALIDAPSNELDPSLREVHPFGNPHFLLSPIALGQSGKEIAAALTRVDPGHGAIYQRGEIAFAAKMEALSRDVAKILEPLRLRAAGKPVVIEYHREFTYFLRNYGLESYGAIEKGPGTPQSAGRLVELADAAKKAGVQIVLAARDDPPDTLARFHELSGIPIVISPLMIEPKGKIKSYAELQHHIAESIVGAR